MRAGVNVALLALLVPPLGIAGAGLALVGAYVVMLVVMWALIRNLFPVAFEWGRLARFTLVAGGIAAAGELLLPTEGAAGFITRALALAAIGPVLWAARFFRPGELPPPGACSSGRSQLTGRPAHHPPPPPPLNRRLNSSAPSARPSPRSGKSVALTCLAYRFGSCPGRTSARPPATRRSRR